MAGRGQGRGRGRGGQILTFDRLKSLGLTQSDLYSLSGAGQPSSSQALYPPLPRKPIADTNYDPDIVKQAKIARSIRSRLRQKFAFLTVEDKKKDIDRYSDKYHQQDETGWTPDWSQFPDELRPAPPKKGKKGKQRGTQVKPNLEGARKSEQPSTSAETTDPLSGKLAEKLAKAKEQLEARLPDGGHKEEEERVDEEEKEDDKEEEEDEEEGEKEDEVEKQDLDEDVSDYSLNYFDNGEGYGDDDDDKTRRQLTMLGDQNRGTRGELYHPATD